MAASAAAADDDDDVASLSKLIEEEITTHQAFELQHQQRHDDADDKSDTIRDEDIVEVYREWCMAMNDTKRLVEYVMHICNPELKCMFYSNSKVSDNIHICTLSGNLHQCTVSMCEFITESNGVHVCCLCGKVYSSNVLALTASKWYKSEGGGGGTENSSDGYSFPKAPRKVRAIEKFKRKLVINEARRERGMKPLHVTEPKPPKKVQSKTSEELSRARMGRLFGGGIVGAGPAAVARQASTSIAKTGRKRRTSKKERKAKRAGEKRRRDAKKKVLDPEFSRKRMKTTGGIDKLLEATEIKDTRGLCVLAKDKQRKFKPEQTLAAAHNYARAILYESKSAEDEKKRYVGWMANCFHHTWWFIQKGLAIHDNPKNNAYTFQRHCYVSAWMIANEGIMAHDYVIAPRLEWLHSNMPPIESSADYKITQNDVTRGQRTLQMCLNDMPALNIKLFLKEHPMDVI
jgi:hypothetical protein